MAQTLIGRYPAVLIASDSNGETKKLHFNAAGTGTQQIAGVFMILSGDRKGQSYPWYGPMTDAAWKRTLESVRACGWQGTDILNPGPLDQEVEVSLEEEEYQGVTRIRIAFVNRPGGGGMQLKNPLAGGDLQAFANKVRSVSTTVPHIIGKRVAMDETGVPILDAPGAASPAKAPPPATAAPAASSGGWGSPAPSSRVEDEIPF